LVAERLGGSEDDYVLVGSLIDGVVIERGHILHHARLVRRKSKLRQLESLGECLVTSAIEPNADPDQLAEQTRQQLQSIAGVSDAI